MTIQEKIAKREAKNTNVMWTIYDKHNKRILTAASKRNGSMYNTYKQGAKYLEVTLNEYGRNLNSDIKSGKDTTEAKLVCWVLVEMNFETGQIKTVIDTPEDWWVGRN